MPSVYCNDFENGIPICTLGSLYRSFPFRDARPERQNIRPCDYVIIDKASEVSDSDLVILFNIILYSSQPNEDTWPRISLVGDSYHLPPNTRGYRAPSYYYAKKLSFQERITPECSPFLRGLNKISTLQLTVQYLMVPKYVNSQTFPSKCTYADCS